MSRPVLGLFSGRRAAPAPIRSSRDDRFAGLTPVERAVAEAMARSGAAPRGA